MKNKIHSTLLIAVITLIASACTTIKPAGSPKTRLLVHRMKVAKGLSPSAGAEIERELVRSLKRLKGTTCSCILYYKDRDPSLSANRHLTGSLAKIDSSLFLTIRIIDGEKSRIIFSTSKIIKNEKQIKEIIKETAEEIDDKKAVWR